MVSGKHVFCEKSITVNSRQLEECVAIAQEKGLVICDGMTLLHMPLYKELKKKIAEGAIGDVKMVQEHCSSSRTYPKLHSKEAPFLLRAKPDVGIPVRLLRIRAT